MKPSLVALAIPLAALATPRPSRAADDTGRAATVFRQAQQAFGQKNYAAAAAAFEEAAQLVPHPSAWLNAAEAWELDGDLPRAAQDCDRALGMIDAAETHRREANARLARLVPRIATLQTIDRSGGHGLRVTVDGGAEERVPTNDRLPPGKHVVVVLDSSGRPSRRVEVDVAQGETRIEDLTPPTAAPPPPDAAVERAPAGPTPERPPPGRGPSLASWIAFGTSAAASVTAIVAGELTLSARDDFDQAPTFERRDHFYAMRTLTNVAWTVGGGTAVIGVVLWALGPRQASRGTVGTALAEAGAWLVQGGRF
jgi:hypothetical protein